MFKPFKPSGVYPGSGVARGGQQGRPRHVHNGITGSMRGGGVTVGASQPKNYLPKQPFKPASHQQLLAALMMYNPGAR